MVMPVLIKNAVRCIALMAIFFLFTCGTTAGDSVREDSLLKQATAEKKTKYADLLVDINQYTTKGGEFQKTYYNLLIGVAGEIAEKRKMSIVPGTVGFYYDKKSGDKERLYMGMDIHSRKKYPVTLTAEGLTSLKKDVSVIIRTFNSCKSIFSEKAVVGMVIGWKWYRDGGDDFLSLWIDKSDAIKYERKELTLDEVMQRSTITNSLGKIIRLP